MIGESARPCLRALTLLSLLALGCSRSGGPPPAMEAGAARGADVLLVTLDTTRADRIGAYGYERAATPTLDRLAAEGLLFASAFSPAPLTLPAHASLLTGLEPPSHQVHANGLYRLDDAPRTLAEALREEGYETAAFVSAFVLDARYGLARGFDLYDDTVVPLDDQPFGGLDSQRSATAVTTAALEWLSSRGSGRPFFLWVHYYDAHAPYDPPEAFSQDYDGELAYVDTELARLLAAVSASGRTPLVVVAGDHGESLGEHGEPTHSLSIYDATQHVPLVFWAPGLLPAGRVGEIAGLVDVVPSLLHLTGARASNGFDFDGVNLFDGAARPERAIYMETMATYLEHGWAPLFGLRTGALKLVLAPTPELYDVASDPGETKNLYRTAAGERAEARDRLEASLSAELEAMPGLDAIAARARRPNAEELGRLQALGYLGGGDGPAGSEADGPAGSGATLVDPKEMMSVLKLLARANEALGAGRLDEAVGLAERAHTGAPGDLQVLQHLGVLYAQSGRLEAAERTYRDYLALREDANVSILLANVLRELGRPEEARALVERARELEPDHGGVLIALGDFAADEGRYLEALRLYGLAKETDPYRASRTANQRILELRSR